MILGNGGTPNWMVWKCKTHLSMDDHGWFGGDRIIWGPESWSRIRKLEAQGPSNSYSPPARWGLLDFMSVAPPPPPLVLLSSSSPPPPLLLVLLVLLVILVVSRCPRRPRCPPRPPAQPRPSTHSVLCRTSTTTIHAQCCSLPDLNHDHPRPVFPAGPQPRPSTPSVSLPDLNREYPRPVFPAGPQPRPSTPSVPYRTSTASIHAKRYAT